MRLYYNFETNVPDSVSDKPTPYPERITFRHDDGTLFHIECDGDHDWGIKDGVCDGRWKGLDFGIEDADGNIIVEYGDEIEDDMFDELMTKLKDTTVESISIYYEDGFNIPDDMEPTCANLEVYVEYATVSGKEVQIEWEVKGETPLE